MKVDGPNKREFDSVLAQLRHLYWKLMNGHVPNVEAARLIADGVLSRQIARLEMLHRILLEGEPSAAADRTFTSKDGEMAATIAVTPAMRDEIVERVLKFFADHECWAGESYMQCDGPQIGVHEMMSDLIDEVLKPKVEYKE